jgi:hypothetical protein
MNSPRVVSHSGLTLNLATVKCFKISTLFTDDNKNTVVVEFKTRRDYIQHPDTGNFELQEYNETTEMDFPNHEIATTYRNEWEEIWQDYLDDQS